MEESFTIVAAKTEKDFSRAKVLFLEYAKELDMDLCFQNFDRELREISIQYNHPKKSPSVPLFKGGKRGVLLLLKHKKDFIGCVGLRKITDEISEMKRMYIRKEFRGKGLSKKLLKELLNRAKNLGYKSVRLDTLPQMNEAIGLYSSFGFREIKSYRFNPVQGTKYMELKI